LTADSAVVTLKANYGIGDPHAGVIDVVKRLMLVLVGGS
jgi:hypothetical protein